MSGRIKHSTLLAVVVLVALAAIAWWWQRKPEDKPKAAPAIPVEVTVARQQAVAQVVDSVGKVQPRDSAEVRPQTGGIIRRVLVHDGDQVRAGQVLFELESSPLVTSLAQARAQYARDQALASDAGAAAARLKPLADKEYVSARDYESAVSNYKSLQEAAAASKTLIEQARIALDYATVRAPIAGRAGAVLVKTGNLVAANNSNPLLVINVMHPVDLVFSLPQETARELRDALRQQPAGRRLAVEARDSLTQKLRASGHLLFVDNAFGDTSGAVTLKARFDNGDDALWPGEFYALRIILGDDEQSVTVPERSLQQGQNGPYVFVVQNDVARMRPVKVRRILDGTVAIAAGLAAGETVLAALPSTLRDGSAVRITATSGAAAPATASNGGSR
ncbi:hypothetical protein ASF61_06195 [Duganella sp. Leaf126]|uniref:efflux RND transporter periplasmic adaptor subunit n=1 Tax=Duganella sp. Leaf126 TaxID=1736266 RepID=UPI0006F271CF|nr:efflux RND transporter periplasmic adaptor subunit [Duganella sp. Leaf126]KQQ40354.1 hypothetical protein ASF61_06195 [Duganella sp. Leaf126]